MHCAAWLEIVSPGMANSSPLDTEQGICLGNDSLLHLLHDLPVWKAMM